VESVVGVSVRLVGRAAATGSKQNALPIARIFGCWFGRQRAASAAAAAASRPAKLPKIAQSKRAAAPTSFFSAMSERAHSTALQIAGQITVGPMHFDALRRACRPSPGSLPMMRRGCSAQPAGPQRGSAVSDFTSTSAQLHVAQSNTLILNLADCSGSANHACGCGCSRHRRRVKKG
jgi:hypothetical protein